MAETPRVRTLSLDVPGWADHRAGQHVDIRLTAADGYQAERSYSLASAPGDPPSVTVERLDDGEVSPLRAMLRHRAAGGSSVPAKLLYSSRTYEDVIYGEELEQLARRNDGLEVVHTLTRRQPPGWTGYSRRVDLELLREVAFPPDVDPRIYVCGPTSFVETVADGLVALGHRPGSVRTERFGGA